MKIRPGRVWKSNAGKNGEEHMDQRCSNNEGKSKATYKMWMDDKVRKLDQEE